MPAGFRSERMSAQCEEACRSCSGMPLRVLERTIQTSEQRKIYMKRRGTFRIIIGLLLLLAAGGLTYRNVSESNQAGEESEQIAEDLVDAIRERREADKAGKPKEEQVLPEEQRQMPVEELDGKLYLGILDIPDLGLSLPVMAEWDYPSLRRAPCRFTGSYYENNMVVCAHNYARHFGPVRSAAIGTEVYFTNVEGERFSYVISNRETIDPYNVSGMIENDNPLSAGDALWDLTLFTCTTGGQTRVAVRCIRAD